MFSRHFKDFSYINYMENFFIIFLFVQPFIDVLSYFGIKVSVIARVIAMAIGFFYLLILKEYKYKKTILIYLISTGVFFILHTVVNYIYKDPYSLVQEVTYSIKTLFVIQMLIVYYVVFIQIKNRINYEKLIRSAVAFNLSAISIIMLVAEITNSMNPSYDHPGKTGHTGWFYSGNDLSAIVAMSFGIYLLYLFFEKDQKRKIYTYILLPIIIWAMYTIGTKVAFGAVLVGLSTYFIILLIRNIPKRKWLETAIFSVVIASSAIYIPFSAVGFNLGLDSTTLFSRSESKEIIGDPSDTEKVEFVDDRDFNDRVFSGRDHFLRTVKVYWNEAPLAQKLFGMGPGGNYPENLKLIEMDYFDIYYGYGWLGSLLIFSCYFVFLFNILKKLIARKFIDSTVFVLGIQIGLGLFIALFAGHIFLNPASGIYLSLIIAYLNIYLSRDYAEDRELS